MRHLEVNQFDLSDATELLVRVLANDRLQSRGLHLLQ
jgi:hypothetical protein